MKVLVILGVQQHGDSHVLLLGALEMGHELQVLDGVVVPAEVAQAVRRVQEEAGVEVGVGG